MLVNLLTKYGIFLMDVFVEQHIPLILQREKPCATNVKVNDEVIILMSIPSSLLLKLTN